MSDAEEEHTPQQESVSTPESNHDEEEEEISSNSSSDEDVEGQSEDGDYEVETPVGEPTEENGYESAAKSAKESRKSTKIRVADDYNENPDLYGLRRSVSPLVCPTINHADQLPTGTGPADCTTSCKPPPLSTTPHPLTPPFSNLQALHQTSGLGGVVTNAWNRLIVLQIPMTRNRRVAVHVNVENLPPLDRRNVTAPKKTPPKIEIILTYIFSIQASFTSTRL